MSAEEKKLSVIKAACRVISREGVALARLKEIAAGLDCTTGFLSHYFLGKNDLLLSALEYATEELKRSMVEGLPALDGPNRLIAVLSSFFNEDEQYQEMCQVLLAFSIYSIGHGSLSICYRGCLSNLQDTVFNEFVSLQREGVIHPSIDATVETGILFSLATSLGFSCISQPGFCTFKKKKQVLDHLVLSLIHGYYEQI